MRGGSVAGMDAGMFPATQWTELARATLHGDAAGRAALESLCRAYWEPVRRAILAKGWERDDAEDLAQGFFLDFMERGVLNRADRERGKFRTFLQGVLDHWLIDEWRRRHAERRGGGQEAVSWEELSEVMEPEMEGGQVEVFDVAWAEAVMQAALARVMGELAGRHGDGRAAVLGAFLGVGGEVVSYEEGGRRVGLTLAAFKSEVLGWRRRLRECLRAEVRRTVGAPHEIDEEMEYLRRLLERK